jgi:hypothetical protein
MGLLRHRSIDSEGQRGSEHCQVNKPHRRDVRDGTKKGLMDHRARPLVASLCRFRFETSLGWLHTGAIGEPTERKCRFVGAAPEARDGGLSYR